MQAHNVELEELQEEQVGKVAQEYCPGYVDQHGQWNNGFICPKWSTKPTQQYCCGTQYKRYCCSPGEQPLTEAPLSTTLLTTLRPRPMPTSITTTGRSWKPSTAIVGATTEALTTPILQNIPLVVGISAGGVVLLIFLILLLCCVCPCCLLNRNRQKHKQSRQPAEEERSIDRDRDRRISDVSDTSISLHMPMTPTPRSESPTPPGMTLLPTTIIDRHMDRYMAGHDLCNGVALTRTTHSPYKGLVVGTVPPYIRDEAPAYPEEVLETLKPLMYTQFSCSQKNCPKCREARIPDVYPHEEVEAVPHTMGHTMSTPLSTSISSLQSHHYPHLKQGRYVRPLTPVLTAQGYRHYHLQNRGYIM